jgi:hypothetical protein
MPQGSEAADAVAARLKAILDAAESEVRRLMLRMTTTNQTSTLERAQNNMVVAAQVRRRIAELGAAVGEEAAKAAADAALTEARAKGLTLDPQTARLLDAITQDRIKEIATTWGDAAEAVARAARVATTTGGDLSRLVDEVQAKMGGARASSLAAVDSMTMAAGRQITILDAEATGEPMVYGYGGPVDSITRPFCREHHTRLTRQVYTRRALDRLDNPGQPTPVSVYLGGYNCRHNLQPMTRAMAKDKGYTVIE